MGYNREDIIQHLAEQRIKKSLSVKTLVDYCMEEYGYGQSYAYELVREARKLIAEYHKDWALGALEESIAELEDVRQEARKAKDRKQYLEISKELYKLKGLHQQKLDITSGGEKITGIDIRIINDKEEDETKD